jgi:hypothetical protein
MLRTAVNEAVYFALALVLTLATLLRRASPLALLGRAQPRRIAHTYAPVVSLAARNSVDDASDSDGDDTSSAMDFNWGWLWTEIGSVLMAVSVAEASIQMLRHGFERAVHVHLLIGLSKGFGMMTIVLIVLAQSAACVNLLLSTCYLRTGTVAPSVVLAATLWFEALVFGDLQDSATVARIASLSLTVAMLAVFRFDRKARNAMAQLPTSGALLAVESTVRKVCAFLRAGFVNPPAAFAIVVWAVRANPFWRTSGILYEYFRGRFQAAFAVASLLFLVAGQDLRGQIRLAWAAARLVTRWRKMVDSLLKRKAVLLGQPFDGRKKAL